MKQKSQGAFKKKLGVLFCGLVSVFALTFTFMLSSLAHADNVVVNAEIQSVLAITAPSNLDLNIMPSSTGALTSGEVEVNVTSNNATGYTLSMSASTDNTALTNTETSDTINSTTNASESPNTLSANTWGWYPSSLSTNPGSSTGNYQFIAIPAVSSAATVKTTAAPSTNDISTVSFGVSVDTSIPAGTYANTVVFSAIANYVQQTITISFDGNGADAGSMANQYIDAGTSQNLNPNGYTRTGFIFSGWNTEPDGTGTPYADQASYQAPAEPSSYSVTLYAQWEEIPAMQDFTNALCQNLASSSNFTVTDLRDNNDYTVRYINGNCWMTQNLRLAGGTTLNSSTSNVSSSYTIPTTDLTTGDNSYTRGEIHDSGNTTKGYWYNYCAASAGTNCSSSNSSNTTYDICPKGWRLPTYNEFSGITGTSYISAFSPVTGGYYNNGSLYDISTYGFWWSSAAYYGSNQYGLYYRNGSLGTGNSNKYNGFYVRCIRSS